MNTTQDVIATLKYVNKFSGQTLLIKLGGAALEDPNVVSTIWDDVKRIRSVGVKVVLVHGGGPSINQELKARGIQWEFIDGQRVTTPAMMEVIEMVLCGLVNQRVVRQLNGSGVPAIGLSGADAGTLLCQQASPKLGQVGKIDHVDTKLIDSILANDTVPVIAPVGMGKDGQAFNVNADWAASRIAQALGIKKVLFLTDQDGILDVRGKVIPELDAAELEQIAEKGIVHGGMLAKVQTVIHALRNGVSDVHILNARRAHSLIEELFTDGGVGTVCRLRSRPATEPKEVRGEA
ncbi:MAG TPA: acetylglutamate kinase [Bdellovibrionota bacterium]|jgi:acetylglutamate kinase